MEETFISVSDLTQKRSCEKVRPLPGRYQFLSSDNKQYLYISEIMEVFGLKESFSQVNSELVNRIVDDRLKAYQPTRELMNSQLPSSLEDVVVHVSQRCNLGCVYCYAKDLNKMNDIMSFDVADSVISRTLSLSREGLSSVKFLGGEPTLAWPVVERLVDGYIRESSTLGFCPPKFIMVTNGTKINNEIADYSSEKGLFIWVSLDGEQTIHDELRPTLGGKGTYYRVTDSIRNLINAGVSIGIEAVYTVNHYEKGITPQDLIDHFLSLGVREIQISPTVGVWHGCHTIEEIEHISSLFSDAARLSIKSYLTNKPYLLRGIDFILRGYVSHVRHQHVCGAGRTFMAINYDGEAFPCYLLESSETSYGFIGDGWDFDRYVDIQQRFFENGKDNHLACSECWANEICKSCLGTSFQISKNITKPPRWFCTFQKSIIESVLAEIASASESENWQLFVENISNGLRGNHFKAQMV